MRLGVFGINSGSSYRPEDTSPSRGSPRSSASTRSGPASTSSRPSPRVSPSPMEPEDPILDPLVAPRVRGRRHRAAAARHRDHHPPAAEPARPRQAGGDPRRAVRGRLLLGIGAGYLEPEMTAIGVPMAGRAAHRRPPRRHARHLDPTRPVEHHGPFIDFAGIDAHPRPVTPGGPRIVVGGHTPAAYRRAVTSGHGWYGFGLTPEQTAACLAGLREASDQVERPPTRHPRAERHPSPPPRPRGARSLHDRRRRPPRAEHRQRPRPRRRRAADALRRRPARLSQTTTSSGSPDDGVDCRAGTRADDERGQGHTHRIGAWRKGEVLRG